MILSKFIAANIRFVLILALLVLVAQFFVFPFSGLKASSLLVTVSTPVPVLEVDIDIKPGGDVNPINPKSKGKIPVAILSKAGFDAPADVDRLSLTFGRTGNELSLHKCNKKGFDVSGDGLDDLMCHFSTQTSGFQPGDTEGILRGKTIAGADIEGTDSIKTVGK